MPKRGYHHGNLRQALVDAALALIEEKGPTGFTLSEAAKQAGVTQAVESETLAAAMDAIAVAEKAEPGANILCMLPDTGERLLLVRHLDLGRLPAGLSAQALSLLIESATTCTSLGSCTALSK